MTLDCTNLKPGDRVRLRNGDIGVVERNDHDLVPIQLKGYTECHYSNGEWNPSKSHDFDIVEILTNPEPEMNTTTFPFSWRYHLGTLGLSDFTWREPARITVNGKQYVPANSLPEPIIDRSPSLSYPLPHQPALTVSATTNEVVWITYNGKRFTPADSWPEPITDRKPELEDADLNGQVMRLDGDGNWIRYAWYEVRELPYEGWAKTSGWKPTPLDKKALTLRDLKESIRTGDNPDYDTLQSAIELLEAT